MMCHEHMSEHTYWNVVLDMRIGLQALLPDCTLSCTTTCLRLQGVGMSSPLLAFILNPLQQADDSQHNIGLCGKEIISFLEC